MRRNYSVLSVAILMAVAGCRDSSGTYSVSGAVTFQGKPVPRGAVGFISDYSKGNRSPRSYAKIIDGNYATPSGKGHGGGAYTMRVVGFDGVPVRMPDGEIDENGSPLFPTYEESIKLKAAAEVIDIDVPAGS